MKAQEELLDYPGVGIGVGVGVGGVGVNKMLKLKLKTLYILNPRLDLVSI